MDRAASGFYAQQEKNCNYNIYGLKSVCEIKVTLH